MSISLSRPGRFVLRAACLVAVAALLLLSLAGCSSSGSSDQPALGSQPASASPSPTQTLANPPAVTGGKIVPGDTSSWPVANRTAQGVAYSFRYPTGWKADLSYCAPGSAPAGNQSFRVPAGCAVTDILAGQKATSVGQLPGDALTLDGKHALRQVDTHPASGMAACIYTVMLYDANGAPLFGFSTSIGVGTDPTTRDALTTTLDEIAGTLHVEKQP